MGTTLLLVLGFLSVMLLFMSVGLFFGRKPLRGSCGGIASNDGCGACGAPANAACSNEEHSKG